MNRVARRDRITIDLARARPVPGTDQVDAPGHLPIIGTFDYPEFGTVEHVPREVAHDPASLATLRGIPLTIDHPMGMVDASNWRQLSHGVVLDYTPTDDGVDVIVRVASKDAIEAGKGGLVQLSLGYDCEVDDVPGVDAAGKPFTGTQRGRVYNHLAQVGLARVGAGARLRFDAMQTSKLKIGKRTYTIAAILATSLKGAVVSDEQRKDASIETAEIVIDGVTMVLPRAVVDQIVAMLSGGAGPATPEAPVDAAPVDPAAQTPADPNAPPRMDGLTPAQAAAVRKLVREETEATAARHDAAARERLSVERQAGEVLGPSFDYDGSDTYGIAQAVIVHLDAAAKPATEALVAAARKGDARAAGRLLGRFDAAISSWQALYDNGAELGQEIDGRRRDSAAAGDDDEQDEDGSDSARQRMIARMHGDKGGKTGKGQRALAEAAE